MVLWIRNRLKRINLDFFSEFVVRNENCVILKRKHVEAREEEEERKH